MFRNVARKPIPQTKTYLKFGFIVENESHLCPRCKSILNAGPNYQPKYCDQCGQKIDFSSIEWKEDKELEYEEGREACESVKDRVVRPYVESHNRMQA